MSCNLSKVVDEVLKLLHNVPGQDARVTKAQRDISVQAKAIAKLSILEKNMQAGYVRMTKAREDSIRKLDKAIAQRKEQDLKALKENEQLNIVTEGVDISDMPSEYYAMMKRLVDSIVKPNYVNNPEALFLQANEGKLIGGTYTPSTNTISTSELTAEQIKAQAKKLTVEALADSITTEETTDEDYAKLVATIQGDPRIMDLLEDRVKEQAVEMFAAYAKVKGGHALYHELVHAGTVRYMRANPDSELTQQMNNLYKTALEHKTDIASDIGKSPYDDMYWAKNVEEFVAEALTNPLMIRALANVYVDGAKYRRSINSVFRAVVDVALKMLGIDKTDNVYAEVLKTYTAILEAQITPTEAQNVVTDVIDVTKAINDKLLDVKGSRYSSYMKAVAAVIDDIVKPIKVEDANMLIEGYLKHQKFVAGQYDIRTHTVTFATAGTYEGYKSVAEQIVAAKYVTEIDDTKVERGATDLVVNRKNVTNEVAEVAKRLEATIQELVDTDGRHITLHEMIHAATARHMIAAPDSLGVKRIKELYRLALDYKAQIVEQLDDGIDGEYWSTNVQEFVAEALSNPKLMAALDGITVKRQGKISSLFKELYTSIMSLFGFTNEDSLYGYVLDGFMRIMEEQALNTEAELHSPAAKFKAKLDKILSSKTKEAILELTKDCR